MRRRHGDNLSLIGRVRQYFLVTGERGIKNNLSVGILGGLGAEAPTLKHTAAGEREISFYFSHAKSLSNTKVSSRLLPSEMSAHFAFTDFSSSLTKCLASAGNLLKSFNS